MAKSDVRKHLIRLLREFRLVNKCWFCRYPRPVEVVYDNGSEFKLYFEHLLSTYGVERKPTSIKNPQANGILERTHQTFGNMLRNF